MVSRPTPGTLAAQIGTIVIPVFIDQSDLFTVRFQRWDFC
jgi:hypothetical protein